MSDNEERNPFQVTGLAKSHLGEFYAALVHRDFIHPAGMISAVVYGKVDSSESFSIHSRVVCVHTPSGNQARFRVNSIDDNGMPNADDLQAQFEQRFRTPSVVGRLFETGSEADCARERDEVENITFWQKPDREVWDFFRRLFASNERDRKDIDNLVLECFLKSLQFQRSREEPGL